MVESPSGEPFIGEAPETAWNREQLTSSPKWTNINLLVWYFFEISTLRTEPDFIGASFRAAGGQKRTHRCKFLKAHQPTLEARAEMATARRVQKKYGSRFDAF